MKKKASKNAEKAKIITKKNLISNKIQNQEIKQQISISTIVATVTECQRS